MALDCKWHELKRDPFELHRYFKREWVRYGRSIREIATRLHVNPSTVSRAIRKLRLKKTAKLGRQKRTDRRIRCIRFRNGQKYFREIKLRDLARLGDPYWFNYYLRDYKVTPRTLLRWAKLLGVPVPDRRRWKKSADRDSEA